MTQTSLPYRTTIARARVAFYLYPSTEATSSPCGAHLEPNPPTPWYVTIASMVWTPHL